MAFKKLEGLLSRQVKQAGLEQDIQTAQILQEANRLIDDFFGQGVSEQQAHAVAMKYGRLQIATMNAALRHELTDRSEEMRDKLNTSIGKPLVKKIQIII